MSDCKINCYQFDLQVSSDNESEDGSKHEEQSSPIIDDDIHNLCQDIDNDDIAETIGDIKDILDAENETNNDNTVIDHDVIDDDLGASNDHDVIDDDLGASNDNDVIDDVIEANNDNDVIDDGIETNNNNDVIDVVIEANNDNDVIDDGIETNNNNDVIGDGIETNNNNDVIDDDIAANNDVIDDGIETNNDNDVIDDGIETNNDNDVIDDGIENKNVVIDDDIEADTDHDVTNVANNNTGREEDVDQLDDILQDDPWQIEQDEVRSSIPCFIMLCFRSVYSKIVLFGFQYMSDLKYRVFFF